MITLIVLSIAIFSGYTIALCVKNKEIPYSVSATFYTLKNHTSFGWCMAVPAFLLLHPLMVISNQFEQVLSIVACVGLLGVGLNPDFKADGKTNRVHCISAALTLICSQAWVLLQGHYTVFALAWTLYILYTLLYMYTHRSSSLIKTFIRSRPMFWVEIAALLVFYHTLISLL